MKKGKKERGGFSEGDFPIGAGKDSGEGIVEPAFKPEVSVIRETGFMGFAKDTAPARVDVKNGRIVRIRPLRYDDEG